MLRRRIKRCKHFPTHSGKQLAPALGGEIGIVLLELVPPVGLAVMAVEWTLDGLYWLRRRLD